jgi:hypothetical protein
MAIQIVVPDTSVTTYFVVAYDHNTNEFYVATEKSDAHFGGCNTEVTSDSDAEYGIEPEWIDLGESEWVEIANDLSIKLERN